MTIIQENTVIKALSWREPYGSLMLPPHNKIETRTRWTNYRGLVLICASKKSYDWDDVMGISGQVQFDRIIDRMKQKNEGHGKLWYTDYHGLAFAVGKLVGCRRMMKEDEDKCFVKYFPDLWCHIYTNVRPIKPIPWKGSLGFSNVPKEVKRQIEFL